MKRKAISFLLVLVLALSLLPVPAYAAAGVKISSTNFPDTKFRNYVRTFDKNKNGTLSDTELAAATHMFISSTGIASLKGIEYFTALTVLDCPNNTLKTLDLSKNTALKELYCADNKLTALDLSKNTKLVSLGCPYNSIRTLNVSKCTRLEYLDCWENKLTALDVSNSTKLKTLFCGHNGLKTLDVSRNTALTELDCTSNQLTKLNISKNKKLTKLSCVSNSISTLNIGASAALVVTYVMGDRDDYGTFARYEKDDSYLLADYSARITGYQIRITAQPQNQIVSPGNAAKYTVTATGPNLQYQWYRKYNNDTEWYPMWGETDRTLVVSTSRYETVGSQFYCGITCVGKRETLGATSETAKLTFIKRPQIVTQPKSASVTAGKAVTFKVKATGGALKYQWYVIKSGTAKWVSIKGKTASSLKLTAKKSMNGNKYRCRVKNDAGFVYSDIVKLRVK